MTRTTEDVRRATSRFASGLADADPAAEVPSCPGWTVLDLVAHLGNIHAWAAGVVDTGRRGPASEDRPDPGRLQTWYAERAGVLLTALEASDPEAPCWNFAGVQETKGFWRRRQMLETQMHLVDLDQAHGRPTDLEADDCADGVTETCEIFLPRLHARGYPADLAEPVSFVATDTRHRWTLTPCEGLPPALTLASGVLANDRLQGTAEQLWLLLWKRADDGVERIGDAERLSRLLASRLTG
ncbi:MAG: maleylpyruvate isomerase family mycothiol-dependent enzyme [Actinomycetota bacterium]|nr:maleylpyruvate isomerase family mycothiol-dependent enzyme [Actinomycetota bacterium]